MLVAALRDDKDADVREHAAESLGQIGIFSPEVIAALTVALQDQSPRVRRDAVRSWASSVRPPSGAPVPSCSRTTPKMSARLPKSP